MCDESLAADKATPCEKLFELANASQLVIARIVAANASISPDVVAALQLRKDSKINRALAANPATPMAILQKLGVRYTSEFVHNPIFKMEQISDPLFLTHLPARLLEKILTHESTPESILLWACEHRGDFDFAKYDTVGWLISSPRSMMVVCSKLPARIRLQHICKLGIRNLKPLINIRAGWGCRRRPAPEQDRLCSNGRCRCCRAA